MQPIPAFNPGDTTTYPDGNGVIQVGAADAGSKMLLYNESPFNINIDFLNGSQSILHAWEARYWTLDGDTRQVEWDINSTLNVSNSPISLVIGELYNAGERLEGTYPMGLIRQTNVGNTGGIATTSTNQVINDGNTLQEVIEATLSGHVSSDVIVNNDGSYTLKGVGLLAAVGILTHILGTLTVDQLTTLTGGALLPNNVAIQGNDSGGVAHNILNVAANNHVQILPAGSGIDQMDGSGNILLRTTSTAVIVNKVLQMLNNVAIQSADSGGVQRSMLSMDGTNKTHVGSGAVGAEVRFDDSAGTQLGWFNSGGGGNVNGRFKSPGFEWAGSGFLTNYAHQIANLASGHQTYTHNLGWTPNFVLAIATVSGGGSATVGWDNATTTTVGITVGATLHYDIYFFSGT